MYADISFPNHTQQQHFGFGCLMRGIDVEAISPTRVIATYADPDKIVDLVHDHYGEIHKVVR